LFSKLIIDSPWYYFALSLFAGLAAALLLYYRNKSTGDTPKWVRYALFGLRFAAVTTIAFLLLNIFLRKVSTETENPVVILALDNSSSMIAGPDSAFVRNELPSLLQKFRDKTGSRFAVKTMLFGSHAQQGENPGYDEKETDLDELIGSVQNNYANLNVGAMVLVTDGIYNKGANPLQAAEKLGFPVYSVATGDTTEIKDVAILKVNHNQIAFLGNNFPVEVELSAKKFDGKKIVVTIYENGAVRATQEINIRGNSFYGTSNFTLNAAASGIARYTAAVSVLEGERNISNNRLPFVVEVIDNKEKVLLLANSVHPDISAIGESVRKGTTFELEVAMAAGFNKPLKAYSLVILHGYSPDMLHALNECRNNHIPYWLVNPVSSGNLPGVKISASMGRYNDAEAVPQKSFGLFTTSPGLLKFISEAPAVKTFFGNYELSPGANSLINQKLGTVETDQPILYFEERDGLKSAVLLGDGLWRWRLRDYADHENHSLFNELISKTVQYLSVKSDKSYFRLKAPAITSENRSVELSAEVYNKSYELVSDPDVVLELTNQESKKFNYTFSKNGGAYRLNLGLLPAGEYRYKAQVKQNNELYVKNGVFAVKEVVAEKLNTVANHALLYQLAHRTGGKVYAAGELSQLEKELLANEKIRPVTYAQSLTLPLIELQWIFWIIIMLLAAEWAFRKSYLTI
jgi:hypothetical protein